MRTRRDSVTVQIPLADDGAFVLNGDDPNRFSPRLPAKAKGYWAIDGGEIRIEQSKKPNWWVRMWMLFFIGWEWVSYK